MKFICWPQSGQSRLRSACVPFREISVRQADSDGTVICSSQPGFVEISFGEIKVMHGQEYPSGLREIFRRNWRIGVEARLGKAQSDLAAGLILMALSQENLRDCQADADAISTGQIDRLRKAQHRGIPVAKGQQSISRRRQYFHPSATQFFS